MKFVILWSRFVKATPSPQAGILITTTTWSRVLLEKLTVTQLAKKFPAFYGTRRFKTVFTRVRL
jgi:hypothetical protein